MLTLLCGADRVLTSAALLRAVCARASSGLPGNILIVPEQYSHETERALCAAGGDTISRFAEVLSFTRLSARVAATCGGVCEEYLDEGGRILTVYLAAQQILPQLKLYAPAAAKPAFLAQLASAVEEFLSYCLTPDDLRGAASHSEGQFAQRLQELALLYESYLSVCKTGRSDPVTRLYRLNDQLFEADYAADKTFFLDGFSDFTAIQLQILTTLLPQSDLTVALPTGDGEQSVFASAASTARALKNLAARLHVPVQTQQIAAPAHRAPDTQRWLSGLFARAAEPDVAPAPHILTHQSDSVAAECAFAAAYVRSLVRGGLRCREVTIAVTDPAAYLPVLRSTFSRAGLPAYFAGDTPLLQSPTVGALRSALHATERYDYESVLTYLKSPLSPLTRDAADRLERYAFRWNLHGLAWEREFTAHPRGYGQPWTEEDRTELALLEFWRAAAIAPLQTLRQALRSAPTAAVQTEALAAFLAKTGLAQTLAEKAARLTASGDAQRAQQTQQLYESLLQALEQLWRLAGTQSMDQETFLQIFDLLLGCYQIGTIPATADQVLIGPLPSMRHSRTRVLLILGAEEGKFPAFQTPTGLLSEEDRTQLLALGCALAPARQIRLERELGWVYASLAAVQETIVLSTGGGQPSYLVQRTDRLFPNHPVLRDEDDPYLPDAPAAAAPFVRAGQPERLSSHPVLLQAAWELQSRASFDFTPLRAQTVERLYGRELPLSASKIDRFSACKYQYFLQYGLRTEPWKQARFDAPIFGTFVHYVLEKTVQDVMAQGGFAAVGDTALADIADGHIEAYSDACLPAGSARSARFSYLFARSRREVQEIVADIGRELRASAFRPADTELSFRPGGALPPVTVQTPGGCSRITGFVDRVDLYDTGPMAYYRVVDYKTGRKDFDYADLLEGEGLQMLIYLFALRRYGSARYGKPIEPAGVLYVPSRADIERIAPGEDPEKIRALRQKKRRRKGLVLADDAVLQAMEPGSTYEYLPVQSKKDGLTGDLATREQFAQMERFVDQSLQNLTDSMLSGAVAPDPLVRGPMASSCQFCEFGAACHQDLCAIHRRYLRSVQPEQFWNELERRLRDAGHTDPPSTGSR